MENEVKESIFSEQVMEYSQKQILDLDKNFSFQNFIQGAKKREQFLEDVKKTALNL